MIYSYSNIAHSITKAQSFTNYIVLEILCRANKPGMPAKFDQSAIIAKYIALVRDVNPKYIVDPLDGAYQICKTLRKDELKIIRRALHHNTNIKGICEGTIMPVLYSQIKVINYKLANFLYIFCKNLYTEVMKLKPFSDLYGTLKNHYSCFSISNGLKNKRCPFCGVSRMLNEFNSKKEAYDHYFPKEQYPFSSTHFLNLAPMCHTCNSSYKSRKNPINTKNFGKNKKIFYPFKIYGKITFIVNFNRLDLDNLTLNDITVNNTLQGFNEEIESWEDIFGIKERYKGIYAGDSFTWFEEARIATKNFGESYLDHKSNLNDNYFNNENFLKVAFFDESERLGLI